MDTLIYYLLSLTRFRFTRWCIQLFEWLICGLYLFNQKFINKIQIFSNGTLYTLLRKQRTKILLKTLDLNHPLDRKVSHLSNSGFVKLFEMSEFDVKNTTHYFQQQKIYNSHVPLKRDVGTMSVQEFLSKPDCHYGSFDIPTSLRSYAIQALCTKPEIWQVARKYLNSDQVHLYSINTMLTKQSENKNYVVYPHRDYDSASSVCFFIYWTPTSETNGATKFLPGSHLDSNPPDIDLFYQHLEGPAGTVYAADVWGIHAGNDAVTSPRLTTWLRFSATTTRSYYLDKNYIFRDDLKEVNKRMGYENN